MEGIELKSIFRHKKGLVSNKPNYRENNNPRMIF